MRAAGHGCSKMKAGWFYFCLVSSMAVPGRFYSLYYKAFDQPASQIGVLLSMQTLTGLFASPLLSHVADRRGREVTLIYLQIGITISFLLQFPLHEVDWITLSPSALFTLLLLLGIVGGVLAAPLLAISKGIVIARLQGEFGREGHLQWGPTRSWGALGWGLTSVLVGGLFDLPNLGMSAIFIAQLVFSGVFMAFTVVMMREVGDREVNGSETALLADGKRETGDMVSLWAEIRPVIFQGGFENLLLFNLLFWIDVGIAIIENLLFLYLSSDLHASNLLCGLAVMISTVSELPMYSLSPWILSKTSPENLLCIASTAYIVRVYGYALASETWEILVLELLHGASFSLVNVALVAIMAKRSVVGAEACAQSVPDVVKAVGMTIGTSVGGFVLQMYGAPFLYALSGTIVLIAMASYVAVARFVVSAANE